MTDVTMTEITPTPGGRPRLDTPTGLGTIILFLGLLGVGVLYTAVCAY